MTNAATAEARPTDSRASDRRRLAGFAVAWAAALVSVGAAVVRAPGAGDAKLYWDAFHGPLYAGGFVYPPPAALLFTPAIVLSWPAFAVLFLGALAAAGLWLLWPLPVHLRIPLWIALAATFAWGNAATLFAVPLALAPRWPALWAGVVWAKVSPAVGAISLVRRRRWRDLSFAVGASALVGIATLVLAPGALADWLAQLGRFAFVSSWWIPGLLPWTPPFALRIAVAALVAWFGSSRPWTLALAAVIVTPDLSLATCGLIAAVPRLMQYGVAIIAVPPGSQ